MKNFIGINKTDEEKAEQIKKWLRENTLHVVIGVALGLGGLWGFDYYQTYQQNKAMQARDHYLSIVSNPNNTDAFEILKKDYASSTYTQQADLLMAKQAFSQGNLQEALNYLLPLTRSQDEFTALNAKFRAVSIYLEMNDTDKALEVLGEDTNAAFAVFYNNIKGDIYFAKNDIEKAKFHYNLALSKLEKNSNFRNIIQIKLNDLLP